MVRVAAGLVAGRGRLGYGAYAKKSDGRDAGSVATACSRVVGNARPTTIAIGAGTGRKCRRTLAGAVLRLRA